MNQEPTSFPPQLPQAPQQPQAPLPPQPDPQQQKKAARKQQLKGLASFGSFVVSIILLAVAINMFVFQSYYVDGTSMTPTLQPNDRLIINKLPKTWANLRGKDFNPKRGNIIVFNSPYVSSNGTPEQLIKRVIGLPGDRVVINNGIITVYNTQHPEGFNPDEQEKLTLAPTDGNVDVVVPQGEIFVCGDNRVPGGSLDSRSDLGTVGEDKIVGELSLRIFPLNKMARF